MKGNQFYTVFGVVTAVLLGAAGFYVYKSHDSYKNADGQFDTRSRAMVRLKQSKPYPNEENLKKIEKEVTSYEADINGLFQILARFQQPLDTSINDTQFPQTLKSKLDAFKGLAKKKGVKITDEGEFYMAMDAYRNTLPNPKSVPLLNYQLGAIEYLLNLLVEAGVTELISVNRELLPVEVSPDNPNEGAPGGSLSVAAKYPVSLAFETKHPAFEKVVNQITNDNKYFFILRALRVDNSAKEGAEKGGGENEGLRYVDAAGEAAPAELVSQIPQDLEVSAQIGWMSDKGYEVKSVDARILLGDESLRVFMVVDMVRFADASKKSAATEAGGAVKEGEKK